MKGEPIMSAKELQKRNEKAQQLKVLQSEEGHFYVESSEGKILYRVTMNDEELGCTCGDYARNSRTDPNFRCKHMLAVMHCVPNGDVTPAEFLDVRKPRLDDRFITTIQGREFVLYSGLLDLAHQKGLMRLDVEPIQYPTRDNGNEGICRAVAESKLGEVFSDIGDANPKNCNEKIAAHVLRMASTRAKARALRDFTNIGITCLEELGDLDEVIGNNVRPFPKQQRTSTKKETPASEKTTGKGKKESKAAEKKETKEQSSDVKTDPESASPSPSPVQTTPETQDAAEMPTQTVVPKMSEAQRRAVYNLSRRRGISLEELDRLATETYGVTVEQLSSGDAASFIRTLQQSA